jgi:hypothetical protein
MSNKTNTLDMIQETEQHETIESTARTVESNDDLSVTHDEETAQRDCLDLSARARSDQDDDTSIHDKLPADLSMSSGGVATQEEMMESPAAMESEEDTSLSEPHDEELPHRNGLNHPDDLEHCLPVSSVNDDDAASIAIHDQLPTVEQYLTDFAIRTSQDNAAPKRIRSVFLNRRTAGLIMAVFLVSFIGILTGSLAPRGNDSPDSSNHEDDKDREYYIARGIYNANPEEREKVLALQDLVIANGWSTKEDVFKLGTAPWHAIQWLVVRDDYHANVAAGVSSVMLRERYAATVLYYSLQGPMDVSGFSASGWTYKLNFLSPNVSICDWNEPFIGENGNGTDGSTSRFLVGLSCHNGSNAGAYRTVKSFLAPENNLQGSVPAEIKLLADIEEINCTFVGCLLPLSGLRVLPASSSCQKTFCNSLPVFISLELLRPSLRMLFL